MATISAAQSTGIVTLSGSTNDVVTISSAVGAITIINVSGTSPLSVLAGAVDPGAITAGQAGTFTVLPNSYITLDAKYGQQVVVRVVGSGNQYTVQGAGRASMGNYLDSNQLAGVRADFFSVFGPPPRMPVTAVASGRYYAFPAFSVAGSGTISNGTAYYCQVVFPIDVVAVRIGIRVSGAGGAGSVHRLGIHNDNGVCAPGVVLLDAGTVDSTTTGTKEITISQALRANVIYWAVVAQQGNPTPVATVQVSSSQQGVGNATNPNYALTAFQAGGITGALADSPSVYGTNAAGSAASVVLKVA